MPDHPDSGKAPPPDLPTRRPTLADQHWRALLRQKKTEDLQHDMLEAISGNDTWRFKILLQLDEEWGRQDFLRRTVETGRIEMFKALTARNPEWERYSGPNALASEAAEAGQLDFVKLFVEQYKADIHYYNEEMLRNASRAGREEVVGYLLSKGADPEAWGGDPLWNAVDGGHLGVVKKLIDGGADINGNRNAALETAARSGHVAIVEYLLQKGAEAGDGEVLVSAARNGHAPIVKLLLDSGVKATVRDNDALIGAIDAKALDAAKMLVEAGADVNAQSGRALRNAAGRGEIESAKFLLDNGANPNLVAYRDTPLTEAVRTGDKKMTDLLLRKGADISALHFEALRVARRNNSRTMARALVDGARAAVILRQGDKLKEFGAAFTGDYSIDDLRRLKTPTGDTGLMLAAQTGKFADIVKAAKGGQLEPADLFHPDDRLDTVMTLLAKNKNLQQFFDPAFWVERTDQVVESYQNLPPALKSRVRLDAITAQINHKKMKNMKGAGPSLKPPKLGGY